MPKNHRFMPKIARKHLISRFLTYFGSIFSPLKQAQGLFFSLPPAERILKYIHPRIRGKKPRLLDPHGYVLGFSSPSGIATFFIR